MSPKLLRHLQLPKQKSSIAPDYVWTNSDQDPVPVEKRTWTGTTFALYWFSDLVTVSTWSAASAILTLGLSASDAVWITLVAAICNAVPTVLNGAIGADLHIPFPIIIRASFGYYMSWFAVASRGILALFWFGVQSAGGGTAVTQIIISIWPSYRTLPNHLPASAGITTQGMVSYLLYHMLQTPFMFIPTHKLKWMFLTKTILVPPMALSMVIYLAVKAGTGGDFFHAPPTISGSTRAWLWLSSLTSITGGFSTLAVNISDFSRFSRTPGAQVYQLPFIPFFKIVVSLFGIISASASKSLYGKILWQPLDIVAIWNTQGSGGRAASFFCATIWCLAQICVNVSANSISFGNDITSLWPRYFNIRRGMLFAAVVGGWAMVPWIILSSGKTFLNFMSAYAVFMAPLAAIMMVDYFVIHKRKYDVPALYDPRGIYGYWNWRSAATTLLVIVPLLPALGNKVTPATVQVPQAMSNLFSINWLYGFFASLVLYYFFNLVHPNKRAFVDEVVHRDVFQGVEVSGGENSSVEISTAEKGSRAMTATETDVRSEEKYA